MPKSLTMSKMHEPPLRHLTGCRYAVIVHLAKLFKAAMSKKRQTSSKRSIGHGGAGPDETAIERIGEDLGSFDWN